LIQVFCIQLVGEPLILSEGTEEVGFYRNEYVVAQSEEDAIAAAKRKAMKRLKRKAARFVEGKPFTLKVERVKLGMPFWRLLRNEGFLFFPVDEHDLH
jgi:hypothetical protein